MCQSQGCSVLSLWCPWDNPCFPCATVPDYFPMTVSFCDSFVDPDPFFLSGKTAYKMRGSVFLISFFGIRHRLCKISWPQVFVFCLFLKNILYLLTYPFLHLRILSLKNEWPAGSGRFLKTFFINHLDFVYFPSLVSWVCLIFASVQSIPSLNLCRADLVVINPFSLFWLWDFLICPSIMIESLLDMNQADSCDLPKLEIRLAQPFWP